MQRGKIGAQASRLTTSPDFCNTTAEQACDYERPQSAASGLTRTQVILQP